MGWNGRFEGRHAVSVRSELWGCRKVSSHGNRVDRHRCVWCVLGGHGWCVGRTGIADVWTGRNMITKGSKKD